MSNFITISPTITITATPDYSANDVVGGIITLADVLSVTGRNALLTSIAMQESGGQVPALTIMLFRSSPSGGTYTDNGAVTWHANDLAKHVATYRIATGDWLSYGSVAFVNPSVLGKVISSATKDLYALIFADGTYNAGAATALTARFGFQRN